MIVISDTAAREIKRLQGARQQLNSYLRISVASGGCSGLFYHLELNDILAGGDRQYHSNGIAIAVSEASHPYLEDLTLDYSEDLMGGCFRFKNPHATQSCSCGQSFSVPVKEN